MAMIDPSMGPNCGKEFTMVQVFARSFKWNFGPQPMPPFAKLNSFSCILSNFAPYNKRTHPLFETMF